MSETRESRFWGRMVAALWRVDRVLNRIENGVLDGMPDTYVGIDGVSNWIELKCPVEPARPTTALFSGNHPLSISQRNWLLAHRQAGCRGWVAIETASCVMLIGAQWADSVNKGTLQELQALAHFWAPRPLRDDHWLGFVESLNNKEYLP